MGETLVCPVIGEIDKKTCRDWRARATEFSPRNTRAVQMFRACNRCPVNTKDALASETTKSSKGAFNGQ